MSDDFEVYSEEIILEPMIVSYCQCGYGMGCAGSGSGGGCQCGYGMGCAGSG